MKDIIIYGVGPVAINAYFNFWEYSDYNVVAFTVDEDYINQTSIMGKRVIPFEIIQKTYLPEKFQMFVGVGYVGGNTVRDEKCNEALSKGYELISFIHPKAAVFSDLIFGYNCYIASCVSIQHNVRLGNGVFLNENCNVGHDTFIDNNSYIGGGACVSGRVVIKNNVFLGKGSIIRDGVMIGQNCIIGAGVTMLENAKPRKVYMAPKPIESPFSSDGIL